MLVCACGLRTVSHVLEGKQVCGVTSLGDEIFLLRPKGHKEIEVYDVTSFQLRRCLTVPNARSFMDMTSCEHFWCLYIADDDVTCIHRVDLRGNAKQWPLDKAKPRGLSVNNADHNLMVTCPHVRKIKEFSPRGELLRDVSLPDDVINPLHAVRLTCGMFVVSHGRSKDRVHRVCVISEDGREIVHSHSGQRVPGIGYYDVPNHLAVDGKDSVYVVDVSNRRVILLSPKLEFLSQVVSPDQLEGKPYRICLDAKRSRLYVTDNIPESIKGRVQMYNV